MALEEFGAETPANVDNWGLDAEATAVGLRSKASGVWTGTWRKGVLALNKELANACNSSTEAPRALTTSTRFLLKAIPPPTSHRR